MGLLLWREGAEKEMTLKEIKAVDEKKAELKKQVFRLLISLAVIFLLISTVFSMQAHAAGINVSVNSGTGEEGQFGTLQVLLLFAVLALAPSLLIMMTSFTRIVIVFSFLRNALGIQQTPPNMVIVGLSLFLSLFIMTPVFSEMNETAIEPYTKGEITQEVALDNIQKPLKVFMLKQTGVKELNMFLSLSGNENALTEINPESLMDLGLEVIVPSFITSELKRAFTIGFLLFIPFLIIDMVVSSALMSMGMVMLPPSMISLPFKLMLFVVVDGWGLLIETLVQSFH